MNLIFRLLIVLLNAHRRGRLHVNDTARVTMLVLPNDLDLNMHVNNGRYLSIMDLGRIDFIIRVGLLRSFIKNRWSPVIGGTIIRHRFSVRAFERFQIATNVIGWDDKWFYFEQRLETEKGPAAIALSKGLVRDKSGTVSPARVLAAVGIDQPPPAATHALTRWLSADELLHEEPPSH